MVLLIVIPCKVVKQGTKVGPCSCMDMKVMVLEQREPYTPHRYHLIHGFSYPWRSRKLFPLDTGHSCILFICTLNETILHLICTLVLGFTWTCWCWWAPFPYKAVPYGSRSICKAVILIVWVLCSWIPVLGKTTMELREICFRWVR